MNDTELVTIVRESFTGVHATTPPDQIARRGRTVRARRRSPLAAGAVALAAGAAAAVFAVTARPPVQPPQPAQPGNAQLAAWTVTRQADGTVRVTIRQLMDPAGLQARLRAVGVPATVTPIGEPNPSCRTYPASKALLARVFTSTFEVTPPSRQLQANLPQQVPGLVTVLLIHPTALPAGTGVQIMASFAPVVSSGATHTQHGTIQRPTLVYASQACTGS
jgi:hypothetical protein